MNVYAKLFLILALLLAATSTVRGESQLDSIQQLNEVVVTANRYSEVIPSQKLTGKELESLNSLSVGCDNYFVKLLYRVKLTFSSYS